MSVLSLKYRPTKLSEVIGQPVVTRTLTNAILSNQMHHAYLFHGSMGSGKTSVSRILACSENCLVSPGLNPCGKCNVCIKVSEGCHVDIQEIDAASNAGKVEQIRKLKSTAQYGTVDGAKTRYFIIDEFHAASNESCQSLLKFLEEPPDNVRFVLCTTEINKIVPTILSRCQVHEFRKIYWRTLAEYLEVIAKKEGIEVTKDSLLLCAKLSSGSVRNALQNLDKLITYSGESKTISYDDALSTFSVASDSMFYDLIDQIIGHGGQPDATNAYKIVNNLLLSGTSFNLICDNISELLRNILVGLTSSSAGDLLMISDSSKMRLKEQIKKCKGKIPAILESISVLNNSRVSEEYGLSPDISLQTWIVQSIFMFQR